jgi:hypothetical protein
VATMATMATSRARSRGRIDERPDRRPFPSGRASAAAGALVARGGGDLASCRRVAPGRPLRR